MRALLSTFILALASSLANGNTEAQAAALHAYYQEAEEDFFKSFFCVLTPEIKEQCLKALTEALEIKDEMEGRARKEA